MRICEINIRAFYEEELRMNLTLHLQTICTMYPPSDLPDLAEKDKILDTKMYL